MVKNIPQVSAPPLTQAPLLSAGIGNKCPTSNLSPSYRQKFEISAPLKSASLLLAKI